MSPSPSASTGTSRPSPDIEFWFINSSRAIRIAWALEALSLPYKLHSTPRAKNGLAPPEFRATIPTPMHKSPAIRDGDEVIYESGAILEYLCDRYDLEGALYPKDVDTRNQIRVWLHAAEGTFAVHCMAILYARWNIPDEISEHLSTMEKGMSANVFNDLGWLEGALKEQRSKGKDFLVGEGLSIADIQMHFIILFIYERQICVSWGDGRFPEVEGWMKRIEATSSFRRTKEKVGWTMNGDFRK